MLNEEQRKEVVEHREQVCRKEGHTPIHLWIYGWTCGVCGKDLNHKCTSPGVE